jgi:DnaJ domain
MHKVGIEVQATRDLYKLLGLPREASQDDIRKAHRKLVRKHHPDAKLGDRSSEERFKEIQRAYEVPFRILTRGASTIRSFARLPEGVLAGHARRLVEEPKGRVRRLLLKTSLTS